MEALDNAAPRIARALLADQTKRAATIDPLTGLQNRRGFDETFRLTTTKEGALVYADLDRFKNLNDTLGHPAGDAALVHFARIIREQIRTFDVAGRIGGRGVRGLAPGDRPRARWQDRRADPDQAGHHGLGLARPAVAAERVLRSGGVPRDQPQPRQPAGPGRLGAVRGQAKRAEPGGEGGAVSGKDGKDGKKKTVEGVTETTAALSTARYMEAQGIEPWSE